MPLSPDNRVRRSLLFVPGDKPDRVQKATTLPTDAVIIDLEDGVDPKRKQKARECTFAVMPTLDLGRRELAVRINAAESEYFSDDLAALATCSRKPDIVIVPKVDFAASLVRVSRELALRGVRCSLLPCVETARGVLGAAEIGAACVENIGLLFGGHDLAAELGSSPGWETLLFGRSRVAIAAAAARIGAIDTVWSDLADLDGLAGECGRVRRLGYSGKAAIHPRQLEVINAAFSPSEEELAWARRVAEAAGVHGSGAFPLDGKMIDKPTVEAALRTLSIGKRLVNRPSADYC